MRKSSIPLSQLKASKVAGINQEAIQELEKPAKKGKKLPNQPCEQVLWMRSRMAWWSLHTGIEVKNECRFHPTRRWRFDMSIPSKLIGIEYDGVMSAKSRHTTLSGFTEDTEKINAAQALGWKVLRFTCKNYKSVLREVEKVIESLK